VALPVVVLAGGLGTRIAAVTGPDRPKALLDVGGEPFLVRRLRELADDGVAEVVLLVGHGAAEVREAIGDGGALGVAVRYVEDGPRLLGTGGAIRAALDVLPERFTLTYGDTFLPVALAPVEAAFTACAQPALMTVLRNDDRWEPSNVEVADGLVTRYEKGQRGMTHVDYGLLVFERSVFEPYAAGEAFDLGVVLRDLVDARRLAAHEVAERFHEIGTPESYAATVAWAVGDVPEGQPGEDPAP
jgi:N-acetyl-alpha-D-muramate 1-phosphate uridylyltransferase